MKSEEGRKLFNEKIFQIFSTFMERVTKFEELLKEGHRYLFDFWQGLEYLRRPSIDTTSELVVRIVKANNTRRLSSYVQAGCLNADVGKQNMIKLSTSHLGLLENLQKATSVVRELQGLVDDAAAVVQANNGHLLSCQDEDTDLDESSSTTLCDRKLGIIDYSILISLIYGMVKQDYEMQERIVSSLSPKSSSDELESYYRMWSLRPFVDDELMLKAWKLI